jgi:UDP-2,3-diacylglucosamine pyrophosphatase LpxH
MKEDAAQRFINGDKAEDIAKQIGCHPTSIRQWANKLVKTSKVVARKGSKVRVSHGVHDAIIYLRHARDAMKVVIVADPTRLEDPAYLFAMLALNVLEGRS